MRIGTDLERYGARARHFPAEPSLALISGRQGRKD
jgi:hypothetical protein